MLQKQTKSGTKGKSKINKLNFLRVFTILLWTQQCQYKVSFLHLSEKDDGEHMLVSGNEEKRDPTGIPYRLALQVFNPATFAFCQWQQKRGMY